jgi:hypothetical protein
LQARVGITLAVTYPTLISPIISFPSLEANMKRKKENI